MVDRRRKCHDYYCRIVVNNQASLYRSIVTIISYKVRHDRWQLVNRICKMHEINNRWQDIVLTIAVCVILLTGLSREDILFVFFRTYRCCA
jgi:hypothetical protein